MPEAVRITYAENLAIVLTNFVMSRRLYLIVNLKSPLSEHEVRRQALAHQFRLTYFRRRNGWEIFLIYSFPLVFRCCQFLYVGLEALTRSTLLLLISSAWFIQGHRFTILEGTGCSFAFNQTTLLVALYMIWLTIFATVASVYACRPYKKNVLHLS